MKWTYIQRDLGGAEWWDIIADEQIIVKAYKEEHAKRICDEHNAHAALLAACEAARDVLEGAWPDPDDDWKSVVFVDDREVVQAQVNAAIDLAKPPSSVMAEKGK